MLNTKKTQATRLYELFGGVPSLHASLARASSVLGESPYDISTLYRWGQVHGRGSRGRVPSTAWPTIEKAAELEGVALPSSVFDPRLL
jgi:hypothetical protein